MRAEEEGGRGRRVLSSLARRAFLALFCVTLLLTAASSTTAQTAPNVTGAWNGSYVGSPPSGPFPGGVWTTHFDLRQSGTTVVGTSFSINSGYYIFAAETGTISGSTVTLTSSAISNNLPFGYTVCYGTGTFSLSGNHLTATSGGSCGGETYTPIDLVGGGYDKQQGKPATGAGDPIDMGTGNVFAEFKDYETAGPNKLAFIRYYNSNPSSPYMASDCGNCGWVVSLDHWTTNFDRRLSFVSSTQVTATRRDGQGITFTLTGGVWKPDTDTDITLTNSGTVWTLTTHDDTVETYNQVASVGSVPFTVGLLASIKTRNGYTQTVNRNAGQQISSVTDSYGRSLGFTYGGLGRLATVTTPDGLVLTFGYTGVFLTSVSYSTSPITSKTYNYDSLGDLLSVTDENGNALITWTYDAYGRGLSSQSAGGVDNYTVSYNDSNNTRTVTNGLSQPIVYTLVNFNNIGKVTKIARTATSTVPAGSETFAYDANGFTSKVTDWSGHVTNYTNNAHGDPTTIVEAYGTAQARTTTITYDTVCVHLPASIVTPGVTTTYTYDANCNVLTKTLTDTTTTSVPYSTNGQTHTWNYTWSNFLPHTVQTPNGNTTTFTYDASGALINTANALSQSIQVTSHTGGGLPLTIVDPNSVTTTLTYSPRNWLLTKTVTTGAGNLTTTYAYDPAGNLTSVTQPDGSVLTNTYDIANRLTKVADSFGNSLNYTLDALGDATGTQTKDTGGTVKKSTPAVFDSLGRRTKLTNGSGFATTWAYTANGVVATYTPPNQANGYTLDALDRRLTEAVYPYGNITYTYDPHDRPLTVTSRNGSVTSYVYDGFGNKIQETSPDRGTTVYHYDADGNLTSKTDSLSIVANYTYDALDRMLTTSYPADTAENVTYTYDQTGTGFSFGIGRLTSLTDMAGSLTRAYDERGNIVTEKRVNGATTLTTGYTYDNASRLATITYPSGALVTYVRDAMGRVTSVTGKPYGGSTTTLASSVTYLPFGPHLSLSYGNGINETATYDGNYDLLTLKDIGTATVQNIGYTYSPYYDIPSVYADNLNTANSINIGLDGLYRINGFSTSGLGSISYGMDNNNNRTSFGSGKTITYSPTTSNRIATIVSGGVTTTVTTDARGSITGFSPGYGTAAVTGLTYNNAGRLSSVSNAGGTLGSYIYDAMGRRYSKATSTATTLFTHSPTSTLLEEVTGGVATDYIYLNDRPIAMLTSGTFTYLHGDKLGRPQVATNASQTVLWRASYMPFGETLSTSGSFVVNLRMPGQYLDAETGFAHNINRDYVPSLGRYLESDPIGLEGGMNTFAYSSLRPMDLSDPLGLRDDCTPDNTYGASNAWEHFNDTLADPETQTRIDVDILNLTLSPSPLGKEAAAEDIGEILLGTTENSNTRGSSQLSFPQLDPDESWGNSETLSDHFERHGADFGAATEQDYANQASEFFRQSQEDGLPTKIDENGTIRVYDPNSNTFGAYNPDGTTRTFFKPSSPTYWNRQPGVSPTTFGGPQ